MRILILGLSDFSLIKCIKISKIHLIVVFIFPIVLYYIESFNLILSNKIHLTYKSTELFLCVCFGF